MKGGSREPAREVPPSLAWLVEEPGGQLWLRDLPSLVSECSEQWQLLVGRPFAGNVSFVAPATTAGGTEVVLKIGFPHPDSEHEAAALALWEGRGAVRILDYDWERRALLLERCIPGNNLWGESENVATEALAGVLEELWETPGLRGSFQALSSAARVWAEDLRAAYEKVERPFEKEIFEEAIAFLATVREPRSDDVILHQDLHGGNVLRQGDGWVAIDPKPLVGERAFDLTSYVRDRRDELASEPDAEKIVRTRLDRLSSRLDVDRESARGWALAHALAWGFDDDGNFYPDHVLAARLIARC
ncbi:MAG: aminoglycoside phosphotransferase family protein [Actinomycetota bacterium]|nr:aminoglycoside phosphotransferase family protein [Actinomycetota bacterium]